LRLLTALAMAMMLVGCTTRSTSEASPILKQGISNGTTLEVSLYLNGQRVADDRPDEPAPSIDAAKLPPPPWTVEARSSSGRILTSMTVKAGQVWATSGLGGEADYGGAIGRVDLSCGTLIIWAGYIQPSGGPAPPPSPGPPGDCVP
jgi:hypothetical protein